MNSTDEDRRRALFSAINPENEAATQEKISFWTSQILELLTTSPESRISLNTLNMHVLFQTDGLIPLCLEDVVTHLISRKEFVPAQESSILTRFAAFFSTPTLYLSRPDYRIVSSKLLDSYTALILKSTQDEETKVMDHKRYTQILVDLGLDIVLDHGLITAHLIKTKQVCERASGELTVYKFRSPTGVLEPVDDAELGELVLSGSCTKVQSQIRNLELQIASLSMEAREAIQTKQRPRALASLKKKRLLESVLEKRFGSLATLHAILEGLKTAQSELQILQAYAIGSRSLKSVLARKEFADVQETLDGVVEGLEGLEDLEEVMRGGEELVGGVDMEELEKELDVLVELEAFKQKQKMLDNLDVHGQALPKISLTAEPVVTVPNIVESVEVAPTLVEPVTESPDVASSILPATDVIEDKSESVAAELVDKIVEEERNVFKTSSQAKQQKKKTKQRIAE